MNKSKTSFETKTLAEIVVFAALSGTLYIIRPFSLPYGGSVTLGSMVPVMWLSLRRGVRVGFVAGAIFGLLALLIDVMLLPYSPITNPVQVILEYPIAFGVLGLTGLFHRKTAPFAVVGAAISVLVKFLLHFTAGLIFWTYTFPEGWNPVVWSAVYNGSFLLPEFIISAILLYVLVETGALKYRL